MGFNLGRKNTLHLKEEKALERGKINYFVEKRKRKPWVSAENRLPRLRNWGNIGF